MRYIRDFFYNFSDIIFAAIVTAGIAYVLFFNLNHLVNIETQAGLSTLIVNETSEEKTIEIDVTIPSNLTIEQLADILLEYNIISSDTNFINEFKDANLIIKSGNYTLKSNMSNSELRDIIFNK